MLLLFPLEPPTTIRLKLLLSRRDSWAALPAFSRALFRTWSGAGYIHRAIAAGNSPTEGAAAVSCLVDRLLECLD